MCQFYYKYKLVKNTIWGKTIADAKFSKTKSKTNVYLETGLENKELWNLTAAKQVNKKLTLNFNEIEAPRIKGRGSEHVEFNIGYFVESSMQIN